MTPDEEGLAAQFRAALQNAAVDDIRALMHSFDQRVREFPDAALRPDRRRPAREDVARYQVRIDLDDARPPIWRRLELRSDLRLDQVHQAIQAAFGWWDYHLHRFALGGHPFDWHSQLFLCPFDVEEGEDAGLPTSEVRVDEVMQEPGDKLRYVYDYGDSWELTLKLEKVLPHDEGQAPVVCVGGRMAAPPEDSRGVEDPAELAEILGLDDYDPTYFDPDEVNEALAMSATPLPAYAVHPGLRGLIDRLRDAPWGRDLHQRMTRLLSAAPELDDADRLDDLRPYQWFLDRAADGGIALTAAGYLKPADVVSAAAVMPSAADWIGKKNREDQTRPVLAFRTSLQSLGLLRKHRGRLLLTRAGAAAQRDPEELWEHLVKRVVPERGGFAQEATLLLLAYAATSEGVRLPIDALTAALEDLGWRTDGAPMSWAVHDLPAMAVLSNLGASSDDLGGGVQVSSSAAALAAEAISNY